MFGLHENDFELLRQLRQLRLKMVESVHHGPFEGEVLQVQRERPYICELSEVAGVFRHVQVLRVQGLRDLWIKVPTARKATQEPRKVLLSRREKERAVEVRGSFLLCLMKRASHAI